MSLLQERVLQPARLTLVAATLLAACSSSSNAPPAHDGAAHDAAAGGDMRAPDAPAAEAGDTRDAPAGDASDGAVACVPACTTGMACVEGACLPAPVVLARVNGCGNARLALAGANVYWTERATGAVKRLAVASPGGTPTIVAMNQMSPGPISTDDASVYWASDGDLAIRKAPLAGDATDGGVPDGGDGGATDGGVPQPLLTAPGVVNGLLASGGFVYYTSGLSTLRAASAGGTPLTLASFATCKASQPVALALDTGYVYQTDKLSQYITRARNDGTQLVNDPCPPDGGPAQIAAPETITHSQGELYLDALYRAGDEVVWADHTNIYAKLIANATSGREVATSAGANVVTGFVVTGTSVYLAEGADQVVGPTNDTIQVAPLGTPDGSADVPEAKIIAVGQHAAGSFAADATRVYWTTHAPSATAGAPDDCAIVSLAK